VGFAAALAPVAAVPGAGERACTPGEHLLTAAVNNNSGTTPPAAVVYIVTRGSFIVHGADGKPTGASLVPGDFVGAVAFTFTAQPHLTVKAAAVAEAAATDVMDDLLGAAPPPEARVYALPWAAMPILRTSPELRPIFDQMTRCARLARATTGVDLVPLPAATAAAATTAATTAAANATAAGGPTAAATAAGGNAAGDGAILDALTLLTVAVKQVKEDKNAGLKGVPGRPAMLAGLGDEPAAGLYKLNAVYP
jgi:hypothetical protein